MDCEPGTAPYQARQNIMVGNRLQQVWEVRCHPPTHEVASLVMGGQLVGQAADGSFPDPVAIPVRCCGR